MANTNHTALDKSFDRLTDIVCSATPEALVGFLDQLQERGKIGRFEGILIAKAHTFFHEGLDDDGIDAWGDEAQALLDGELSHRELMFINWADVFADCAYTRRPMN